MTDRRRHRSLRRFALGLAFAALAAPAAARPNVEGDGWNVAARAAPAVAAPTGNAASDRGFVQYSIAGETSIATPLISPPPKLSGHRMHWFRRHPSARALQSRRGAFGSVAVLGLESMRDLESLRNDYGFDRVQAIPELHAAEVSLDSTQLRSLLANAPSDHRIRYVSPVGPSRSVLGMPNDPLLRTTNPASNLPYEWQFGVSGVDRALELSPGSPAIVVGIIDSGVADVPDLAGKVDGRWSFVNGLVPVSSDGDGTGHGTAVASLIAANGDDGFGMAGFGGRGARDRLPRGRPDRSGDRDRADEAGVARCPNHQHEHRREQAK